MNEIKELFTTGAYYKSRMETFTTNITAFTIRYQLLMNKLLHAYEKMNLESGTSFSVSMSDMFVFSRGHFSEYDIERSVFVDFVEVMRAQHDKALMFVMPKTRGEPVIFMVSDVHNSRAKVFKVDTN